MFIRLFLIAQLSLILSCSTAFAAVDWDPYKTRFLAVDGRVVDTGNQNVSHSEGQGFGMLFAVSAADKESFDKIWNWTKKYLQDPKTGLFYWRYKYANANPIEDKNNATDGDVLIAWALLKAGNLWNEQRYLTESDKILHGLLKYTVKDFSGRKVLLPGKEGFVFSDHVNLNPSYFIFPAWKDFADRGYFDEIYTLIADTQELLEQINWGQHKVPTDWITLYSDGTTSPASDWPARVSYDAIRVPLYMKWDRPDNPLLDRWKGMYSQYTRQFTPAWENVSTLNKASYVMTGGLLAVRDLTMGELSYTETQVSHQDDYYSASLKLLAALALQRL
ncbi:glycosyl hydrolase family 8 [Vibrio sp. JC009]|uniref:glycosyl hydrolase family 8 n=1 Tax=Vibrio sp. JC009 TaxID=2912314 RepID=UPI0023B0B4E9|nr:glycosyl hydrolase family 8 [Vibrio sp. JC009]WED20650.1 glycosyl hydrolase family 8 [Vibrio sp. JC009]